MKTNLFLIILLAITLGLAPAFAVEHPNAAFWRNPAFVNKFTGSYGFNSDVEPKITEAEQTLFKELVPSIESSPAAAINRLETALKPDSSAALDFTLGNLLFQSERLDAAAVHYQNAIRKFPDFLRAHRNLGLLLVRQGNLREALPPLIRTLELGGEDGDTYGLIGYCYLSGENFLSAEAAYRKALLFAPENLDWKFGTARCLLAQQRHKEAAALFEELIRNDPNTSDYWLFQANAFIAEGEPMRAAANLEVVRRMDKAGAETLHLLGDIYLNQGINDLSAEVYAASLRGEETRDLGRPMRAAQLLMSRGAMDEAGSLVAAMRSGAAAISDADELQLLKLESRIALVSGDSDAAVAALKRVLERDPLDGEAILILASNHERSEMVEEAELLYTRAAKIKGFESEALTRHAQFLVSRNQYERAIELLERAQEFETRNNVARYLEQVRRIARVAP